MKWVFSAAAVAGHEKENRNFIGTWSRQEERTEESRSALSWRLSLDWKEGMMVTGVLMMRASTRVHPELLRRSVWLCYVWVTAVTWHVLHHPLCWLSCSLYPMSPSFLAYARSGVARSPAVHWKRITQLWSSHGCDVMKITWLTWTWFPLMPVVLRVWLPNTRQQHSGIC